MADRMGLGGEQKKEKKAVAIDLNRMMDKQVRIKFTGGRESESVLFLFTYAMLLRALLL